MAERLNTSAPRKRRWYPWADWTDGSVWKALEGKDFTCSASSFQTALHLRARQENKTVVTGSPEPGVVEFQFAPKAVDDVDLPEASNG